MMCLRKTRIDMMQVLASNYEEWFYGEIRELTTIAQSLMLIVHPTVSKRVAMIESRLRTIDGEYRKKAIKPIKKLAARASGAKSEEEHNSQFMLALDGAWKLIVEVRNIRYELDMIATSAGISLPQPTSGPSSALYV
jgi:hypothetical protein